MKLDLRFIFTDDPCQFVYKFTGPDGQTHGRGVRLDSPADFNPAIADGINDLWEACQ